MGIEIDPKLRLYIRLPVKIVDEHQIKELHPAITRVTLVRQKSARYCLIDFADRDSLEAAKADIRKKRINEKKIIVQNYQSSKDKKPKSNPLNKPADSLLNLLAKKEKEESSM